MMTPRKHSRWIVTPMLPPGDRLWGPQEDTGREEGQRCKALCHSALEFILKHLQRVTLRIRELVAPEFCRAIFLLCLYWQNEPKDQGTPRNSLFLSTQTDCSPALTIFFWAVSICELHTA